jgi:Zn finger protein HypA/HybF involved in hydrogenase expression
MSVQPLFRSLDQELAALARGASLECLVCGEFVQQVLGGLRCCECGSTLQAVAGSSPEALQLELGGSGPRA